MKKIIAAIAFALSLSAHAASPAQRDQCQRAGEFAKGVAEMRDKGSSKIETTRFIHGQPAWNQAIKDDRDGADALVDLVYKNQDASPEDFLAWITNNCDAIQSQ